MQSRPIEILLVEDNPSDVRLTQEALKDDKVANRMHLARDGVEALDFLFRRNGHEASVRPDIILLDLTLPRVDGREVLAQVKRDPDLRRIPIVVLTASCAEEDILRSYALDVNCYVSKPLDLGRFKKIVSAIDQFWFAIVSLPIESNER